MRERAQRLLAEFAVIVIGVLVALAVDQWRQGLDERQLEDEYAARLLEDLRSDTSDYNRLLGDAFLTKRDFLLALSRGEVPSSGADELELAAHLDESTWGGLVEARDAAFSEMVSSGRIGLLASEELRSALANYYADHGFLSERYFNSPGGYDRLVAEAVPGHIRYAYHAGDPIDPTEVVEGLRTLLRHPGLGEAVNAELAYAGGLVQWHTVLRDRAVRLIDRLEDTYPN